MTKRSVLGDEYEIQTLRIGDLSEVEISEVIDKIKGVHFLFSPSSTEEKIHSRLRKSTESRVDIITHVKSSECCGYSTYYTEQFGSLRVMFRNATIIGGEHRSRGLYKILLNSSISSTELDYVATMTQNPRVYETLRSFSLGGLIYPALGIALPEDVKKIASRFCEEPGFNRDTFVVSGAYERINKDPGFKKVRTSAIENFFTQNLDEDDGFFVIVPLR